MPKKILLVEDDPVARKAMDAMITRHPLLTPIEPVVVHAASGQQGLAVFVAEQPDLIITDLFMPAMDGFALCRAIREAPFGKDIPILVISGIYKDPTLVESLRDEVQARFLPKPLAPEQLAQTILECLGDAAPAADTFGTMAMYSAPTVIAPLQPLPPSASRSAEFPLPGAPLPSPEASVEAPNPPPRQTKDLSQRVVPTSPRGAPSRSGFLEHSHVAKLLFDLADGNATGTLSLTRGRVRKDLYFRNGEIVAADSNLRQEALGNLLCARGIIDESQLAYLLNETKSRGHKMGTVLVELGWMSPEDVLEALAAQARKRLSDCLRWDSGEFSFVPGDDFGDRVIEHKLDMARNIFLGLYRTATPESLVRRFDQDGDRPVELTQRFDRYRSDIEALFGRETSLLLANAPTVGTLALREDANVVMATVDTLIETGLAQLGYAAKQGASANFAEAMESSISLDRLGQEIASRFDAIVLPDANMAYEDSGAIAPSALPMFASAAKTSDEPDSGAIDIGFSIPSNAWGTPGSSGPATLVAPGESVRSALLHDYLLIHGKSYYDQLDLVPEATTADILAAVQKKLAPYTEVALQNIELPAEDHAKLDAVRTAFAQAGRVLSDPAQRAEYDAQVKLSTQAQLDPFGAELAFGEGIQLMQAKAYNDAIGRFQAAVSARPDQALYHAYLAFAEFSEGSPQNLPHVHKRMDYALTLDPDLPEGHVIYGRILAAGGDLPNARAHLERSLQLSPAQPEAIDFLLESYGQPPPPDPRACERFIKQLVSALGDRLEETRNRLWLTLAELYENALGDRSAAQIAYDTAARMSPRDLHTLRKSAEYNAHDPSRWRETSRALAAEWQQNPTDTRYPEQLLDLYAKHGLDDGKILVATGMVLRGIASEREERMAEEGRPTVLRRLTGQLPDNLLGRLGYRDEFREMEEVLAVLAQAGVVPAFTPEDAGIPEAEPPVAESRPSDAFRRVLRYATELAKSGPINRIHEMSVLGLDARMAHLDPPTLLCGPALLDCSDTVELGFRLVRAVALATPGRLVASSRSGGQLRPLFADTMSLLRSSVPVSGSPTSLHALSAEFRDRLLEPARKLARRQQKLNLSAWIRALGRTATRFALLACGDMMRVGRAVAEEEGPEALDEFLLFAISADHLELRQDLGIGNV